jgi:YidC/Oxa1 family membrane protein insertase
VNNQIPHPEDNRNLIWAVVVSLLILLAFHFLYEAPRAERLKEQQARQVALEVNQSGSVDSSSLVEATIEKESQAFVSERVDIRSDKVEGSIALTGARIDDLSLKNYDVSLDNSDPVRLFSPRDTAYPYGGRFGWISPDNNLKLPNEKTRWQIVSGNRLSPDTPLSLQWDNGQGVVFHQTIKLDDDYLFTVEQRVVNNSSSALTLYPYGLISRHNIPKAGQSLFILHEGPVGYIDESLQEPGYDDLDGGRSIEWKDNEAGWIGITDKYWLAALIPDTKAGSTMRFASGQKNQYQADFRGDVLTVQAGDVLSSTHHLFAGAKELEVLDNYEKTLGVAHFDLAIDFGWFYFMTKPFFYLLSFLYGLVGNFGIAIIIFTIMIRLVLFPLANKSFRSMAGMRKVAPQLTEIKERHKDNREAMQKAIMELYQKEKVNPLSGCLPILIQIPIFFALYKVLYVTIEMRHQPFFGWIKDLSLPDPTTMFNLFGIIPWDPPGFLMIGLWPLIMGVTLFLQQKLNPKPQDPVQAKIMQFFPVFMVFLLARFPAGLVIYWSFSNLFSIAQQYVITKRVESEDRSKK